MDHPLAVILGAGPGIGLATARRFGQEGFRLAVVCRPLDAQALRSALPGSLVIARDLALPEGPGPALAEIEAWGGFPEVLVCNASAGAPGPAADLAPAQVLSDLQVNVASALAGVRWALPAMRAREKGTLLFTGGGLALAPKAGLASTSLGKAAQRSLALSLAEELESEGIHAATLMVGGFVQPGSSLSPEAVAQAFWELHRQPRGAWDKERVLA